MRTLRLISLLILITSCTSRSPQKGVPVIDLENPAVTRDLYLSELLDDIRVVKLETNDEILLGQNTNYLASGRIKRIQTRVDNLISQIIVSGDSMLTIVPRMNREYNLYNLTTSGRFINGISPPEVIGIGLQTSIDIVMNELYYMPKEYDTLYLVKGTSCKPYCFFHIGDRFTYENNEIGNFVYLSANAPGFIIANKAHASIKLNDDGETFSMNADKQTRYFINKNNFTVAEIKDFKNDFLGIEENLDQWNSYLFITNNLGFVCYSSFELKQKLAKVLESNKLDNLINQRISTLNQEIKENDNPILVIGSLKTDLPETILNYRR